jgi:type IV pilus assembly protein PilN
MIKINLIPYRTERKNEIIMRQAIAGAVPIVLLIIIMAVVWLINSSQISAQEDEIVQIKTKIEACTLQMKEIDSFKSKKEVLTKKMDVITNLTKGKDGPVHLMDELAMAVPGNLWLTAIKQKGADLILEGKAIDNIAVSNYMINLEKSLYISNVDLKSITMEAAGKAKTGKNAPLKLFIITCKTSNTPEKTG